MKIENVPAKSRRELAGSFTGIYLNANNRTAKEFLEEHIKPSVLPRIRAVKEMHTFFMGSKLSQTQLEKGTQSSIYRFFQKDGIKDLSREVFSFIHPTTNFK